MQTMTIRTLFVSLFFLTATVLAAPVVTPGSKVLPLPGESFQIDGHDAFVILPPDADKDIPWVWYAPTLRGLPARSEVWMFERFLAQGVAIAGIDVGESYGSPSGTALYTALYEHLVNSRQFRAKPCLMARSRGGLMLYNWAVEHPDSVGGVVGIYPVCNIASYPGVARAAGAYELTAEQLEADLTQHNPIDRLKPLAEAGVPVFHIHGDSDKVVPLELNSGELAKRYRGFGGPVEIEVVKGQGHNMWEGWFKSQRLTDFAIARALGRSLEDDRVTPKRPNVLLLSIDDLNDWTGCLGGHPQPKTPNIDRLAKRGTLFTNAHCQSPVCNPSRASLLTGRYPHSSGVYFLSPDLKQAPALKDLDTLPERFAKHGYRTLAAGKIFHTGDKRFFQEYGGSFGGFGPRPKKKISQPHGHPLWDWGAYPDRDEDMPDFKIAQWAVEKLKAQPTEGDAPFFLGVGFYRPHVPMYAPKKWFDLFPRDQVQLPLVRNDDRDDLSAYAIALTNEKHVSPEHTWVKSAGQWEHAVQAYLASTAFADHCLGLVLDALDASPHRDSTIVVLFADHGFHLGEKQRWAKRTIWEDGTRVPLIVAAPGYEAGQRIGKPAQLLDIYPTLLELAGLPTDDGQEGRSLVPLLTSPESEWPHVALSSFGKGNFAVRSERYRYIQYLDGSEELYDHKSDPHEWNNLARDKELAKVIDALRKHVPAQPADVLPGNSTGHQAYKSASRLVGQ